MEKNILNIYCPSCHAPAKYDIVQQNYTCQYCGGEITVEKAQKDKKEEVLKAYPRIQGKYRLDTAECTGCGATLVFAENEAISNCEFCGRSLVRRQYTGEQDIPAYVIPFGITREEAQEMLQEWCAGNSRKDEAKNLKPKIPELKGYYLPYEMIRGPVHCKVSKRNVTGVYEAEGYLKDEFINCSKQLDNLLLDAMEPFDLEYIQEFDFAYVAGHRVKVSDLDEKAVTERLIEEADANYRIPLQKMWGTRTIQTKTTVTEVVRVRALLPVYYISDGATEAAVNGQTGKVCVRAGKPGSFLAIPWWLKGILILLLALAAGFCGLRSIGLEFIVCLYATGCFGLLFVIVFLSMLEDGGSAEFGIFHYPRIFTSGEQTWHREEGELIPDDGVLERRIDDPVFQQKLEGKKKQVVYSFRSLKRTALIVLICFAVLFLPVILALFINGFDFARLELQGSFIWFFIAMPVVPVYLIQFGLQRIYEKPWIYIVNKDGSRTRYWSKSARKEFTENLKTVLDILLSWPNCILTALLILVFCVMVYFTAFGIY